MNDLLEFWLTDDAGRRIQLLKDFAFASYSRTTRGYGTMLFGMPLDALSPTFLSTFQPDMRIDVWRAPAFNVPKRREGSYLLRKPNVYSRAEDGMMMIDFYGRSPIDILRRGYVSPTDAAEYNLTDAIDDMMKSIVRTKFVTDAFCAPVGEFSVDADVSLGPSISQSMAGKNILDVLTDLKATSFQKNQEDSTNRRIFFDVVEGPGLANGFGYTFRTYADLRGVDRSSSGLVFSVENGNLHDPQYYEDHLDEITEVTINNTTVTSSNRYLSRWNHIQVYKASTSSDVNVNTSEANQMLTEKGIKKALTAQFLSTPGSPTQPRSLYGVDWDLGDLLPVQYAGLNFNAEVEIVWVSIDDKGAENIVGSNKVGLE